jgi:hypothetical protein
VAALRVHNSLLQTLERLETNSFIDQATRGLFVEVLLHNSNTNLVTHVRLLLEFESSGIVFTTYRITVIEPDMYDTQLQQFRALCESACFARCCCRLSPAITRVPRSHLLLLSALVCG